MKRTLLMLLVVLGAVGLALAQGGMGGPHGHGPRGRMQGFLAEFGLFPPDFVLSNQTQLGLSDKQILAITKDVGATHDKLGPMQDNVRAMAGQLHDMLNQSKIDESAALDLASQLHDAEKQVKLTHMGLMIRVKNQLTPDQQATLKSLAPPPPARMNGRGAPPPEAPEDNE